MANENVIDTVILASADEQTIRLTNLLKDLDVVMAADIKTANALNSALANSKSFSDYNKNSANTALQLEKIQQAQIKTQASTVKLEETQAKAAAAQKARDEQSAQRLAQQEARQAASDAKQIAAAEAKAAKLQAIQDAQNRKSNTQFATPQESPNPVTTDDSPAVRYEPIITGNENMSATAMKSTEAIAAENAALLEQQEVLGSLTVAQRANIEQLLALQAERAANATELKALNVEDAASGERAVFLTSEQIRLKIAISEVTVALNRQTKEALGADGAMTKLDQSVLLLRTSYEQLSIAERESEQGQAMKAELNALDAENKKLALSIGNTSKQIGDYEKGIGKASTATILAEKVSAQFVRQLVRMTAQFLLITVAIGAITWLYEYIKALEIFNPVASEAEQRQKALSDAFSSSDYTKGLESIEKLKTDLDLASQGFGHGSAAVDEYNKTIGKTFGYVDTLNEAQKGFIDNSADYIKTLYLEAAAQINMADAAKFAAETEVKMQAIRDDLQKTKDRTLTNRLGQQFYTDPTNKLQEADRKERMARDERDLAQEQKRIDDYYAHSLKVNEDFYTQKDKIAKKHGDKGGGDNTVSPSDKLRIDGDNKILEQQKLIAQNKINNDKLTYAERIKATEDFYNISYKIANNNEILQTKGIKLSYDQKKDIVQAFNVEVTQMQITRDNQLASLRDKAYKQDQEHLKNNLEKQALLFKQIVDDPNQSYSMKLIALDQYNKKAEQINNQAFNEAKTEAGKNGKAIKLAKDAFDKADLERKQYVADETIKIQKEAFAKIQEQSSESQQDQLDILDRGSKQALGALDKHKNDLINAKTAERDAGKISEKQYQHDLLLINDAYNVQRIQQEIQTQAAILGIREAQRDSTVFQMQQDKAIPEDIAKYVKGANKGIQATQDVLSGLQTQYDDASTKYKGDKGKPVGKDKDPTKDAEILSLEATAKAVDELDQLRQKSYENEIARLEKLGEEIDKNADNEKTQVQNSIASNATKARELQVIDAKTASQHQALQAQINKEKHKADVAEKEATIAKIILNTALAVIKVTAEAALAAPLLIPGIIALGALELATAIATPLPTYATGTKNKPSGLGIWGEAGIERATLPDGSVQYSPNAATLMNFPKGTVITPHMELMRQIRPEPVKFVGAEQIPWREFIRAVRESKTDRQRNKIVVNVDNGFEQYKRAYLSGKA